MTLADDLHYRRVASSAEQLCRLDKIRLAKDLLRLAEDEVRHSSSFRYSRMSCMLIQVCWTTFITLGAIGLIALCIASSISDPILPGQLGCATGRYILGVLVSAVVLVRIAAVKGWLPGVPAKRLVADDRGVA